MLQSSLRGLCRLQKNLVAGQSYQCGKKLSQHRWMSSLPVSPYIKVSMDETAGVAEMEMCRAPANALTYEFLVHMTSTIKALESDKSCRGVVFTSKLPGIFSAGLELGELYEPEPDRLKKFWTALQNMWLTLYSSKLITVAAISGHAFAGGTTFAIACDAAVMAKGDYMTGFPAPTLGHAPAGGCLIGIASDARLIVDGPYKMGLNESEVGIMVPLWLQDNMINVLGHRRAEYALQHGTLFTPQEALEAGLVDQVVPPTELNAAVKQCMDKFLKIPDQARQMTKASVRKETIDRFHAKREYDLETQMKLIPGASCQSIMGAHLDRLKKKTRRIDT